MLTTKWVMWRHRECECTVHTRVSVMQRGPVQVGHVQLGHVQVGNVQVQRVRCLPSNITLQNQLSDAFYPNPTKISKEDVGANKRPRTVHLQGFQAFRQALPA
jgi:hypothetical protein